MRSLGEYNWPMKSGQPFDHQRQTVEFYLRNKRAYDLSDLGTGKTLSALWASDILFEFGKIRKVLIICPLSTTRVVWGRELFTHFPHRRWDVAHGTKQQRIDVIRSDVHYVIINHDGIKTVEAELVAEGFDIVVVDELTAFKTATSDRSKCMQRLAGRAKSVWGLTGAPTPNGPTEAFGQCRVVNPTNPYLPRYFSRFRDMVEVQIAPYVWVPKPDANRVVFSVMQPAVRHERDKCLDLPPVHNAIREIPMSTEQERVYKAIKEELLYEYSKGEISASNAAVKLSKLLQISSGSAYNDSGEVLNVPSGPKDEALLEIFEEVGRHKLIVVSAFRSSVVRLNEFFLGKGIRSDYIHGDVSPNNRTAIMNRFTDGDLQIMVLQPQTVAHGVNLTVCNTIVWQSFVASGEVHNQMNGRITRAGQTKKQYVIYLVCSKAEGHIVRILQNKMDLSNSVLKTFADGDL